MVYRCELKKLLFDPVLLGFAALCLLVNAVLVCASYGVYRAHFAAAAELRAGFAEASGAAAGAYAVDTAGAAASGAAGGESVDDIFDNFDTNWISERYIARHGLSGAYAENVREKYRLLQAAVDEKGLNDAGLSPYFGYGTADLHALLFKYLFGALAVESGLIALFAALLSLGYENLRGTEGIVCASATGRGILLRKLFAALTAAAAFFAVLLGATLALYFLRFDYSAVWNDNVSSLYNHAVDDYFKPLITWSDFSVGRLVRACAGMTAGLVLCFALLGFAVGAFIRSGYGAVLASVGLCAAMFVAEPLFPCGGVLRGLANLTPVQLLVNIGDWFTDGFADILWRDFERRGLALSASLLAAASAAAALYFKRRDLT
ncbi:MAG: ABC transporter permease subunit [Clostridiales Family XIII bacterium]|jgi:hypothetical protein|nr:ABC transporter permease subunit [Clostridiales Family XIII bacterium]